VEGRARFFKFKTIRDPVPDGFKAKALVIARWTANHNAAITKSVSTALGSFHRRTRNGTATTMRNK
jgi:hypothetical protein